MVRRERDADDRRKVFIVAEPQRMARIGRLYGPLQRAMHGLWDGYSEAELKLLLKFAHQGYEVMLKATTELKEMGETEPKAKPAGPRKPARV